MTEETQKMEVVPLLPCPFCGKEARYVPADYIDGMGEPWPFAECDPCNVGAPVEFWNKRADKVQGEPKPTGLSQGWNLTRKHDGFVIGHQSRSPDTKAIEQAERGGYVWVPFLVHEQPAPVAVVPEKYDDVLLPFLSLMRAELHANARKGDRPGWLQMDRKTAVLEVFYHMGKLHMAVHRNDKVCIKEYAADVANMCMMLTDVCGCLNSVPKP